VYQYVLANLLARNDEALGVLFLDDNGETIDLACPAYDPAEMRVIGAYLGIYLRGLQRFLRANELGEVRLIHVEKERAHIYIVPLPDGYHLALVQRHPALVARARESLYEAVDQLSRELFAS
jgi:hypothetical protein